jgi:hypothetical protein
MVQLADRVKFSTNTTGQGTTIAVGSPESGYQSVPSSLDGKTLRIVIEDGSAWEISTAVYGHSSSEFTSRTLTSSSTGSLLNLSGSAKVFISPSASDLQELVDFSSTFTLPTSDGTSGQVLKTSGSGALTFADPVSSEGSTLEPVKETEFTATANQTTFTVTYAAGNIAVFLNGSKLGAADFTATNGTSVVLATGATLNDLVEVVEYGAPFASPYSSSIHTATANQTSLTVAYTVGKVAVYVNGVKYLVGTDVTATNGTSLTFTSALSAGDKIEVVEHGALADAASAFTDLTDTPSSLGTAGQVVQVNSAGNALEFASASSGGISTGKAIAMAIVFGG